jgi:hypothetical protein
MKTKLLAFVLLLLFPTICHATIKEVMEASCMIFKLIEKEVEEEITDEDGNKKTVKKTVIERRVGSGTLIFQDKERIYILTAGHCTDGYKKLHVIFFNTGVPCAAMEAELLIQKYVKDTIDDIAIISVEKKLFKDYPIPKAMPLGTTEEKITLGRKIISCGTPGGRWPTMFLGSIGPDYGTAFLFLPQPVKGRSGSGIFDEDGTKILGVVIAQRGEIGLAVSIKSIYRLLGDHAKPKPAKIE